jgi:hypothetical protein
MFVCRKLLGENSIGLGLCAMGVTPFPKKDPISDAGVVPIPHAPRDVPSDPMDISASERSRSTDPTDKMPTRDDASGFDWIGIGNPIDGSRCASHGGMLLQLLAMS